MRTVWTCSCVIWSNFRRASTLIQRSSRWVNGLILSGLRMQWRILVWHIKMIDLRWWNRRAARPSLSSHLSRRTVWMLIGRSSSPRTALSTLLRFKGLHLVIFSFDSHLLLCCIWFELPPCLIDWAIKLCWERSRCADWFAVLYLWDEHRLPFLLV